MDAQHGAAPVLATLLLRDRADRERSRRVGPRPMEESKSLIRDIRGVASDRGAAGSPDISVGSDDDWEDVGVDLDGLSDESA